MPETRNRLLQSVKSKEVSTNSSRYSVDERRDTDTAVSGLLLGQTAELYKPLFGVDNHPEKPSVQTQAELNKPLVGVDNHPEKHSVQPQTELNKPLVGVDNHPEKHSVQTQAELNKPFVGVDNHPEKHSVQPQTEENHSTSRCQSKNIPDNMFNTIVTAGASSLITASMLTVIIFQYAQHPENNINSTAVVPYVKNQCSVDLNKSLALVMWENETFLFDLRTANHSFSDLEKQIQHKFGLLYDNNSLVLADLESNVTTMASGVDHVTRGLDQFNGTLLEMNETLEKRYQDQLKLPYEIDVGRQNQQELNSTQKKLETQVSDLARTVRTVEENQQKTEFNWEIILMSVLCALLLEVPLTICILRWCMSTSRGLDFNNDQVQEQTVRIKNGHTVRDSVMRSSGFTSDSLHTSGVSVLSCDGGTLSMAHALVSEVARDRPVQKALVRRMEELRTTTSMMVFVVPFNERNVILEEPGMLQGRRNVDIVQYLLSRGVDVFVIYLGDLDSRDIPPGTLYSPHLTSAERHPILKQLSMKQRFLSIYNEFTTLQKQGIQEGMNRA